ncbi:DUF3618 domain-containing protein [Nocardioides flavescens]|uniref:DUF3618 domain-containing protein n=1 Tax=Nocardioides flavescens TaxID=2691959 RepID=A0A6L7EWW8_9ACTN|nr:DUF3618 domain-containing protein [Nocardioides flavescens]
MSQTPEQLEADIARQREELAATVTELQTKVEDRAKQTARQAAIVGGAAAAVFVVVLVVRKIRARR